MSDSRRKILAAKLNRLKRPAVAPDAVDNENRQILDMLPIPVVMLDGNAIMTHANPAFNALIGSQEGCDGRQCNGEICQKSCSQQSCPLHLTMAGGRAQSFEKKLRGRNYLINTMPLQENGRTRKIVAAYTDLTEIVRSRELLQQAVEKAEDAARAKSRFLALINHEVRTPLNAIVGFAELLREEFSANLPERGKDYINSLIGSSQALHKLLNDILDLAQLDSGKSVNPPERADMANLVDELCRNYLESPKHKKLHFNVNTGDTPPLVLDLPHIKQIISHVLTHTARNNVDGTVNIKITYRNKLLTIEVHDAGTVFDPQHLKEIFDPFVQNNSSLLGNCAIGTGLELPLVKRLTELLDGTIDVSSQPESGTTFTLQFADVPEFEPAEAASASSPALPPDGNGIVFIVDDLPMNLKVLEAILRKLGFKPIPCNSGEEALNRLAECKPRLILTDLWMPQMNGSELAESIRHLPGMASVPVIAVTADTACSENFDMTLFDATLFKPVTSDKLRNLLDK